MTSGEHGFDLPSPRWTCQPVGPLSDVNNICSRVRELPCEWGCSDKSPLKGWEKAKEEVGTSMPFRELLQWSLFTVGKNHPIFHDFGSHIRVMAPTLTSLFHWQPSTIEVRLIATTRGKYLSRRISLFERNPRIKQWNQPKNPMTIFPFRLSLRLHKTRT